MPKVAVAQMVSCQTVEINLQQVKQFFSKAKEEQAEVLVLPENFAFMGPNEKAKLQIAEHYGSGEIQDKLRNFAKEYGLWVIAGTIALKALNDKVRSSCLVFDNHGLCVARYDKIHLFDVRVSEKEVHQESSFVERGDELVVIETPIGRVGLTVCYDLRFPELYRALAQRGAELFTVPSAFTAVTGAAHWEILLRARAIENLSYVIASNQGGTHENGRETHGQTMVIEPWGGILRQQERGEGLIATEIDLERLKQLRRQFPTNEHHVL